MAQERNGIAITRIGQLKNMGNKKEDETWSGLASIIQQEVNEHFTRAFAFCRLRNYFNHDVG